MKKKVIKIVLFSTILLGVSTMMTEKASAHGYVEKPISRGLQGVLDRDTFGWSYADNLYGDVINEPQSLEAPKGFPMHGPKDGEIASAGKVLGSKLDIQTSDQWVKQDMVGGLNSFTWHYTMPHATTKWNYYITKKDWNSNKELTRADFEPLREVEHDGSLASNNPTHQVNIPTDRNGYHVILATWDVADTPMAFYNVIDVNLKNDGDPEPNPETGLPTSPKNIEASYITTNSVDLSWSASVQSTGIKEYNVYRDDKKIQTIGGTKFSDKNLTSDTEYLYTVEAVSFDGKVSEMSEPLKVKTNAIPPEDKETPSIPLNVHSMDITDTTVDLMWFDSTHNIGIKEYEIYRDDKKIGTTTTNVFKDSELKPNTTYTYRVRAVSTGGNKSEKSNPFSVLTKEKPTIPEQTNEWKVGLYTKPILYTAGEAVLHNGKEYTVVITHLNYGDMNWAPGNNNSLFK